MRILRWIGERLIPVGVISSSPMVLVGGMSRSGTTLLAAVLDAHPRLCMGYELIPAPLGMSPSEIAAVLDRGLEAARGDFSRCGSKLRQMGWYELGQWLTRCHRAGAEPGDVRAALGLHKPRARFQSFRQRLRLATAVMEQLARRAETPYFGFKFASHRYREAMARFPEASLLYIVRDPRDMLVSQRAAGFPGKLDAVGRDWCRHLRAFNAVHRRWPERTALLRYEDLVRDPAGTLAAAFAVLPVAYDPAILTFHCSEATVLRSRHPNTANLQRGFFAESVGRWRDELGPAETRRLQRLCEQPMTEQEYPQADTTAADELYSLGAAAIAAQRLRFSKRRKYGPDDYAALLEPYLETHESLRLIDYVRDPEIGDRRILLVRHDVDHDHLTAMKIAQWEHERGIRATYCLLHTAWYYGELDGEHYRHTTDLLECARELLALGHEVNFHNNLVSLGLMTGLDPARILAEELDFFRSHGVPIYGTSTHGDKLCRELNFRNWELFTECCDDRHGGPRAVTRGEHVVELGKYSMFDFGLEYEAYDVARDLYHTDSGGRQRLRKNTRGRRPFGRTDPKRGQVVGVLTHPVWWEF